MRFLHIGDLHLGKVVNNFSMLGDQRHILNQIVGHVKASKPDAVILAGDIFDRSVPPAAAVSLYNDFLKELLITEKTAVFAVAGNHDGADLIHFGHELFEAANYFVAGHFTPKLRKITLKGVNVYLLPFADPVVVREAYKDKEIRSLEDAAKAVMAQNPLDPDARNILVTHGYLSGGVDILEETDSEKRLVIGGKETVSASIYRAFDYVALGHLHRAQPVLSCNVRYSGSILKYSFSEEKDKKSATLVEMDDTGGISVSYLPLKPLREVRTLRGELADLLSQPSSEDYLRVILTDRGEVMEPMAKLREIYPYVMTLSLERDLSERFQSQGIDLDAVSQKTTLELFSDFYFRQRERPLPEAGCKVIENILKTVEGQNETA